MHTQPPDISRPFIITGLIHQNGFLYITFGRLNHLCGSSSHSPLPPGVNVISNITKETGRSSNTFLHSHHHSRRVAHSAAEL
ncbi:hypothetical protein PBY51_009788 [Eleginops maclovinus]|uniref:Uncharacterized protein n=1 Tax=Eleginops maclovinus TaxID=56733 RepID=A0AAN8AN53_ELEMC|nr:hypothetical protein PBY51_009788 [Eleginops maclovinus]